MLNNKKISELRRLLFLILFFRKEGSAYRYPMNLFFDTVLQVEEVWEMWNRYNGSKGNIQLYIHSIYCEKKCNYCNCEVLLQPNEEKYKKYKKYLCDYIEYYGKIIKKPLNSIYFWGGTVNLWSNEDLTELCTKVKNNFQLAPEYVWQVEIHPYHLNENTLKILKDFWVTDIVLAIQTISEKVNRLNNRNFNLQKVEFAIDKVIELSFRRVSFDFMYNLPYMTNEDTITDLNYIYWVGKKIKSHNIDVNLEIHRWDISFKTTFAHIFMKKTGKEKFLDICKYYMEKSKQGTKIVDMYIDKKILWLFDTERTEIEERKFKNTAILGIGLSAQSYIPWVVAYEDCNYQWWGKNKIEYKGYILSDIDNELSFISDNIRRGVSKKVIQKARDKNIKFNEFYAYFKDSFTEKWDELYLNVETDIENDIYNLYIIDEKLLEKWEKLLREKWCKVWFAEEDLDTYTSLFLDYYYDRNKLYW